VRVLQQPAWWCSRTLTTALLLRVWPKVRLRCPACCTTPSRWISVRLLEAAVAGSDVVSSHQLLLVRDDWECCGGVMCSSWATRSYKDERFRMCREVRMDEKKRRERMGSWFPVTTSPQTSASLSMANSDKLIPGSLAALWLHRLRGKGEGGVGGFKEGSGLRI
jgi:hypothetical protein